jgi:hypothetical protein
MCWSFQEILRFSFNKRQLFFVLSLTLIEIINMKAPHGLRNVFGFENFLIFSSVVIKEFIIIYNMSVFKFL